jgi:hypothetical protein
MMTLSVCGVCLPYGECGGLTALVSIRWELAPTWRLSNDASSNAGMRTSIPHGQKQAERNCGGEQRRRATPTPTPSDGRQARPRPAPD